MAETIELTLNGKTYRGTVTENVAVPPAETPIPPTLPPTSPPIIVPPVVVAPPVVAPPVAPGPAVPFDLKQLLADDMSKASEVKPRFTGVNWADAPTKRGFPPRAGFSAFTPWLVVDEAQGGNPQHAAMIQLDSLDAWFYNIKLKKWELLSHTDGKFAGAEYKSDWSNLTKAMDQNVFEGDATMGGIDPGFAIHAYALNRGGFTEGNVGGVVVTCRARLQPGTFKEGPGVKAPAFTMAVALDYWKNKTAQWLADYSNNSDGGIGRFKGVRKEWRMWTMSNIGPAAVGLPPIVGAVA